MKLADLFVGKTGREITHLIKDATVVGLVEVSVPAEVPKKFEDLKKVVSKPSLNGYIVVAFKA